MTQSSQHTNHLAGSKSPYLLQHAQNPVDWFPWGDEAFEKAQNEDKPIFLSIGYSTCHWCHVMERESFEDPSVAEILNRHFVSIKVDREERPDVDSVYMSYVQAVTGSGGWPMSVWLTPELKPFFGGTYFPPDDRSGQVGLKRLLGRIAQAWQNERNKLLNSADSVIEQLRQNAALLSIDTASEVDEGVLDAAFEQLGRSFDSLHGGFGAAPKFPTPPIMDFLLRYHAQTGKKKALEMVLMTLRRMANGGIYDYIGGGFHRYSVDRQWHVPHFEKMLYDQAQLACLYLDSWRITGDSALADTARGVLDYVLRDLRGEEGQFYSAEDADSPRPEQPEKNQEGAFYLWGQSEIESVLAPEDAALFQFVYGTAPEGNITNDPHGEFEDKNVLSRARTQEEAADKFNISHQELEKRLDQMRKRLFKVRARRLRPHLDDKAVTSWNGLMLSALAQAYQAFDEHSYLEAANGAADFIRGNLYDEERGVLLRHYRNGAAPIDGYLDDYAFLIRGLLDLYEAGFNIKHLKWALNLQKTQNRLFEDKEAGGYFNTSGEDSSILVREKSYFDGAEPSGNAVSAHNLLCLKYMLGYEEFGKKAERIFGAFGKIIDSTPHVMPRMLSAVQFYYSGPKQVIISGNPESGDTRALLKAVRRNFVPNIIVLLADGERGQEILSEHQPFIAEMTPGGTAKAYICENRTCRAAVENPEELNF